MSEIDEQNRNTGEQPEEQNPVPEEPEEIIEPSEGDSRETALEEASDDPEEQADQPDQTGGEEPAQDVASEPEPSSEPAEAPEPEPSSEPAEAPEPEPASEPKSEPEEEPGVAEEQEKAESTPEEAPVAAAPKPKPKPKVAPAGKKDGKEPSDDEVDEDFKYIVRIANTDLDGYKTVEQGLTGVSGIGFRLATILADNSGITREKKLGKLSDEEVDKLEEHLKLLKEDIPEWLLNRRKDNITGEDDHIFGPEIKLTLRDDLNRLKMIRCYRGIRHEQGQKVRGQRTRANGRSGVTVGVVKKAVRQKQTAGAKK